MQRTKTNKLMSSSLQVGASLRSPLAMRGRRAADSTTTITTITTVDFALAAVAEGDSRKNNSTRKKNKLLDPAAAGSCCRWGLRYRSPLAMRGRRALDADDRPAQPPSPPSQRWILPSPLLPKATAAKTTAQEKK